MSMIGKNLPLKLIDVVYYINRRSAALNAMLRLRQFMALYPAHGICSGNNRFLFLKVTEIATSVGNYRRCVVHLWYISATMMSE
jgi:hypothetical protein